MKLSDENIKEIAEELQMSMVCYIHKETHKIVRIPIENGFVDWKFWQDDLDKVEKDILSYQKIEPMPSFQSFQIMEDFANTEVPQKEQIQLLSALERRKPFRNFNALIHDSDYRQLWFDYRMKRYMDWVREELEWEF